jgi:glycerol-3-phosphate dehydrogenase (NAD+)
MQIWRRGGKEVDKPTAEHLFEVINAREEVLRRLIRKCAYLNMIDTPFCPLKVVTNLQEAVWDADIVVNVLPSTETRPVFQQIGRFWRERRTMPVIISLAEGVEAALQPVPHIITPHK